MAEFDKKYKELLKEILENGYEYEDPNRTGVKRKQINHFIFKHEFSDGFPLLTLREIDWTKGVGEFVSFISGSTDIRTLWRNEVNFWDKDYMRFTGYDEKQLLHAKTTNKIGKMKMDLGKIYPYQMRSFAGKSDQIKDLIKTMKTNPMATKKTVTMWNPSETQEMSLTPCHWSFEILMQPLTKSQRYLISKLKDVRKKKEEEELGDYFNNVNIPTHGFYLMWHQHSVDVFLGLPTNFVYYGTMTLWLSGVTNTVALGVVGDLTNVHLYDNSYKQSVELFNRNANKHSAPTMNIYKASLEPQKEDFEIVNYNSDSKIRVEMLTYS
jgi:thymidylate synthase